MLTLTHAIDAKVSQLALQSAHEKGKVVRDDDKATEMLVRTYLSEDLDTDTHITRMKLKNGVPGCSVCTKEVRLDGSRCVVDGPAEFYRE